jgi:hypothetical protein
MKNLTITLVLGLFLILGVFYQSMPAHASASNKSADTYTIRYFLDNHGKEKDWTGSRADAQKIIEKEDAKRLAALKNTSHPADIFGQGTKTPARVNPNLNRVDNGPLVCFANSGSQTVTIYSVYRVDSGNNSGSFRANQGPASTNGGAGWYCLPNPISYGKNQTLYPPQNDAWIITSINNN